MSEFNDLVKAFLSGNNLDFKEKEPDTVILSDQEGCKGFMMNLFERMEVRKKSIKIFLIDGEKESELQEDVDIVIWNDSFSGGELKRKVEGIKENKKKAGKNTLFLGMGADILFHKFGENRIETLFNVGELKIDLEGESLFHPGIKNQKRFAFITDEKKEKQLLKNEFNKFLEYFCLKTDPVAQSFPVYFSGLDFWFGGMLHSLLLNKLNQDFGLFLTEDTVFYMVKMGFVIPFIDEIDLFENEGYLNPQAPQIAHLFHLCGERGAFVVGCSMASLFYDDVSDELNPEWEEISARPMGARIMEDTANAQLLPEKIEGRIPLTPGDEIMEANIEILEEWLAKKDFPILNPDDRKILLSKIAVKWMTKGSFFLELNDFHEILFESEILPPGNRTLSHIHEIVRAVMTSKVLTLSDFNQVIPKSCSMGDSIIIWMLDRDYKEKDEYGNHKPLEAWLDREGFNQKILRNFLKRLNKKNNNDVISLFTGALGIINSKSSTTGTKKNPLVMKNALELYTSIINNPISKELQIAPVPLIGNNFYDINISQRVIKNMEFMAADMHNILFQQSVFIGCAFSECNLSSSYFAGSFFLECTFKKSDLRNVDFSGSRFEECKFEENICDGLLLIGCLFKNKNEKKTKIIEDKDYTGKGIWADGSGGIEGYEETLDHPALRYLLQQNNKFYSRYGFFVGSDDEFHHIGYLPERLKENFLSKFDNFCDLLNKNNHEPELFAVKSGILYHKTVKEDKKSLKNAQGIQIDHVFSEVETGTSITKNRILYHDQKDTFIIELKNNEEDGTGDRQSISQYFIGRMVSGIFLNENRILIATDLGGLFLLEKNKEGWNRVDSKFHSEPIHKIFPDCFKNMAILKRGSSVVEIWDTVNDLALWGRLVTSFKNVIDVRLIENLNRMIVYGEWKDGSIGALLYNIINKHLITYWEILPKENIQSQDINKVVEWEHLFKNKIEDIIDILRKKGLRKVSLEEGFIRAGCNELKQVMDSLIVFPPENLTYMQGEPVDFVWKIESKQPSEFPIDKTYIDILTNSKVNFSFEIKIGEILNVQSGKLTPELKDKELYITWKESSFKSQTEDFWGDHKLTLKISLLGDDRQFPYTFKIRPKNPFKGGVSLSKEMKNLFMFIGRDRELETAINLINSGDSFTIRGSRRIGKTSFIHRLREKLPSNVLTVYISLDEFETSSKSKIEGLRTKYPGIYKEFWGDASVNLHSRPIDFKWLIQKGIEKLKEVNPILMGKIWNTLEDQIAKGKSGDILYDTVINYLKSFSDPYKVVFIIDEIGLTSEMEIEMKRLFNPFRPLIENREIILVLAGIPYNFDELEVNANTITDSGLMSYINEKITLGPLTGDECKLLIKNNLSSRIKIDEDALNSAIYLSTGRPEDLQIIMQHAINKAIEDKICIENQNLYVKQNDIGAGFNNLIEKRGHSCFKIWGKISVPGQDYIEAKVKSQLIGINKEDLSSADTSVFSGYGFINPETERLAIPMYFLEWIKRRLYNKNYLTKEENNNEY